jgi:type VI secretion system protein ImpL
MRQENARRRARVAAFAAVAVATAGLGAAWTASYIGNQRLIADAQARASAAKQALESLAAIRAGDEARLLAVLGRLRDLPPRRGDDSWLLHVGLYQGDKLGAQAERAYRNALRETLVPHLAVSLEDALRTGVQPETLAAYVALHEGASADSGAIERGALKLWRLPEQAQAELLAHLRLALAERPLALPRERNEALIEQARRKLGGAKT